MTPRDLESRRRAIADALRGRATATAVPAVRAVPVVPAADRTTRVAVDRLAETVSLLAERVETLSRDIETTTARLTAPAPAPAPAAIRHHIPDTHVPDDHDQDDQVVRTSVPPLVPAKISEHALDVLLGRR